MLIDERYHGAMPDWRRTETAKRGDLLGIELEVHNPNGREASADALDTFIPGNEIPMPIAERDGSIDPALGVEIICPPVTIEQATQDNGYIHRLMQVLRNARTTAEPPNGYGMHVNVNIADWPLAEKLAVQYMLNSFKTLGEQIGRRPEGRRTFGGYIPVYRMTRDRGGVLSTVTYPGDKHSAAYIRMNAARGANRDANGIVMEVRLAKSTLDIQNLRNVVDYVFALRSFVRTAPKHTLACCFLQQATRNSAEFVRTNGNMLEQLFLTWTRKRSPALYDLLQGLAPEVETTANRLGQVQERVKDAADNAINFTNVNLVNANAENTGSKKQALRISTIIGKSLNLQGELVYDGRVDARTVRVAD